MLSKPLTPIHYSSLPAYWECLTKAQDVQRAVLRLKTSVMELQASADVQELSLGKQGLCQHLDEAIKTLQCVLGMVSEKPPSSPG